MPKIIKNQQLIEDSWQVISEDSSSFESDQVLLTYAQYQAEADLLRQQGKSVGIWLDSDFDFETLSQIQGDQCPVIAINFPKFADGRGYSLARILREQLQYKGEIRAIGDVLLDQLYYLSRVGFDAFALREDKDINKAAAMFSTFTENYQATVQQPEPLFQRR